MSLPTQLLHIRFTDELVAQVDKHAKKLYISRSEFIRQATIEKLRQTTVGAFPDKNGFNILLSDEQLEDLWDILKTETRRRRTRRLNG